jgi:hypothetical protein
MHRRPGTQPDTCGTGRDGAVLSHDPWVEIMNGTVLTQPHATWAIVAAATGGVILRPWRLPEALWPLIGASAMIALGLLPRDTDLTMNG